MAHILTATWYESSTSNYVTINDVKVDVPYELKNGDVIKIYSNNGDSSVMFLNGNGIVNIWGTVIDLSDTDVLYEETNFGPSDPFGDSGPVITINYTESTVSRKSIDLTTLPGWSSLSDGSHSITIVAKAENYRDSEPSASVSVTKGAALISFTIAGTSYQAEEGMTWRQWVESSYNTGGYYVYGIAIMTPEKYIVVANLSSTINDGNNYSINNGGSSGGGGK